MTEAIRPQVPVGERGGGSLAGAYHEQLLVSRELTPEQWQRVFRDRTIMTQECQDHTLAIVLRPEFDVPPGRDHMIVTIPNKSRAHPNFSELIKVSPTDAQTMLDLTLSTLESYRHQGCDHVRAVLNNSSFDSGAILRDDSVKKQRLPQSLMIPHFKTGGLKLAELTRHQPSESEQPYINRPLQPELNQIVVHLANKLDIPTRDNGLPAIAVDLSDDSQLLLLYQQIHQILFLVSVYNLGIESIHLDFSGTTRLYRPHSVADESGRVPNSASVRSIEQFLQKESQAPGILLSQTDFESDLQLSNLVAKYLEGQKNYLQAHPDQKMIFGPSYSLLLFDRGKEPVTAHFVPAEFIPKGANTIAGEFPQEIRRPLTPAEIENIRRGNAALFTYLKDTANLPVEFNFNFDLIAYANSFTS
jgi:hypothetical protein